MRDVITLSDLLERILGAHKKASSNSKNESIARIISESLKGMMDDIQKSIDFNEDKPKQQDKTSNLVKTPEIIGHNNGDVVPNVSYTTNGVQHSSSFNSLSKNSSNILDSEKQLSEDHTQNLLLEKYSDLLIKMVEEKLSKVNIPPLNSEFIVTSPIISNGTNSSRPTKGRSSSGGIPVGIGRPKTSKSPK